MTWTWLVSISIQQMVEDVKEDCSIFDNSGDQRAMKWKRRYDLIFDLVREMNQFFGPFLLVFIGIYFTLFGVMSFRAFISYLKNGDTEPSYIMHLVKIAVLMVVIFTSTRHMCSQVN